MINVKVDIDSEIDSFYEYKILSNSKEIDARNREFQLPEEQQEIDLYMEGVFWSRPGGVLMTLLYRLTSLIAGIGDSYAATLKPYNYHYKFTISEQEKNVSISIDPDLELRAYNTKGWKMPVQKSRICEKSYINRWIIFNLLPFIVLTLINILLGVAFFASELSGKVIFGILFWGGIIGESIWLIYKCKVYKEAKKNILPLC